MQITNILYLADLLEMCQFKVFWEQIHSKADLIKSVTGFEDSIRRFVCHVISITYQTIEDKVVGELLGLVQENAVQFWMEQYGWKAVGGGFVTVSNQEEIINRRKNLLQRNNISRRKNFNRKPVVNQIEEEVATKRTVRIKSPSVEDVSPVEKSPAVEDDIPVEKISNSDRRIIEKVLAVEDEESRVGVARHSLDDGSSAAVAADSRDSRPGVAGLSCGKPIRGD